MKRMGINVARLLVMDRSTCRSNEITQVCQVRGNDPWQLRNKEETSMNRRDAEEGAWQSGGDGAVVEGFCRSRSELRSESLP